LNGAGVSSSTRPSGSCRSSVTRPPSSGRLSAQQAVAPSSQGLDRPTCLPVIRLAVIGERQEP
jgi:hypothetical protein